MVKLSVEEILLGIKENDNLVLNYIYDKYYLNFESFVLGNNGSNKDAEDIFQDAIIIIFLKVKDEKLIITCNFNTYLYSVCNKLWLKYLEKNKNNIKTNSFINETNEFDIEDELILKNEKFKLYQKHFKKLSKTCQNVLQLTIKKMPLKKIATKTGFKNAKSVKRRKYKCKKRLIRNIKSDPAYRQINE